MRKPNSGPLRVIVAVLMPSRSLYESARVLLSCGHTAKSWGGIRARCRKCKPTS